VSDNLNPTDRIQYGFKRISVANLTEHDEHPSYPSGLQGDQWVKKCMKPKLKPIVPDEIAFLFEVARGSMVYGMFFLPLASLATEQCFRVLEAGARLRCIQLKLIPTDKASPHKSFPELVEALQKAGKIPAADRKKWNVMIELRNRFSHHTSQTIRARHEAIEQLEYVVELLNRLYTSEAVR
jgi:hypothetical protein